MKEREPDQPDDATLSMVPELAPTLPAGPALGPPSTSGPLLPQRYRDLGRLAAGSFGEVRRVHDTELGRAVAMKILHPSVAGSAHVQARFLTEMRLTAGLEHPGIVAVHDWGRLDDGRLWFTMREVRGRTLAEVIAEVHAAAGLEGFRDTPSGWTFRRLVDAFAKVGQAVAYAHRRGVVHRDLKPDNVMTGELGEVLVMDWGLGRAGAASRDDGGPPSEPSASSQLTQHGDVLGTPAYMPPEQALGRHDLHGPASDVYALGAILYHLLAGRPPYQGSALAVLQQLGAGPPEPVIEAAGRRVPAELAAVCARAMRREIGERYPDAEALAAEVVAWLDGARRREQALAMVVQARGVEPEIALLRARAARLRAEARALLDATRPPDPIERKRPGWALEDKAEQLDVEVAVREAEWLEALHGALSVDPELPEAHAALARHYRDRLIAAERARHRADAARFEARLRAHDRASPASRLRGGGALTLVTDPAGAEVRIERYVPRDRRLVPEDLGVLGTTPIHAIELPRGSYLLRLRAPGRAEVRYPVLIERGGHWDGHAPGEREPTPIALPREGDLGPGEVYVPAGWCWTGGDAEATDSLPARRIWVDAFVLGRSPVTCAEYLAFLDDLAAAGREEEALAACPRWQLGMGDAVDARRMYVRGPDGRFAPVVDVEVGRAWDPDWPVVLVDWHAASAYARWLAGRTGQPWRLPDELEREKAARGADARRCPWGDHLEATFTCAVESHEGPPTRVRVTEVSLDESPYGVLGLAGNTRDWCGNVWRREGPALDGGRLLMDAASPEDPDYRAVKGGAWSSALAQSRAAVRFGCRPNQSRVTTGIRVARSFGGR